ncbi:MAG: Rrf2 family transcriptional regulator [Planctomycetia bacterium]|nr:Rrf2 family transcriptional regulator [Planctomycetia bacterium]
MKITVKTEYACLAALELARHYGQEEPVAVADIAKRYGLSERFLVQVLTTFKKLGIVKSKRGITGGYYLVYRPEYLTLGYIMASMEELPPAQENNGSNEADQALLREVWNSAEQKRQEYLNQTTFADLLKRSDERNIVDYQI